MGILFSGLSNGTLYNHKLQCSTGRWQPRYMSMYIYARIGNVIRGGFMYEL